MYIFGPCDSWQATVPFGFTPLQEIAAHMLVPAQTSRVGASTIHRAVPFRNWLQTSANPDYATGCYVVLCKLAKVPLNIAPIASHSNL